MIDLTNTCVLVRTKEENEMLLKEAEKQEFHWYKKRPLRAITNTIFSGHFKIL